MNTVDSEAEDRRYALLEKIRETPARSLAGLGVKARVAAAVIGNDDVKAEGLNVYMGDQKEALPFDIVGDVLALTGGMGV